MEKEKYDILGRDDRANDLDELDLSRFQFEEGKDYTDYLRKVKDKISDDETNVRSSENRKPVNKGKAKAGMSKRGKDAKEKSDKDILDLDHRTTLIAFMTTKEIGNAIKIIAGAYGKTVSTLVNDSVKAYLSSEIDKVIGLGLLEQITRKDI